MIERGGWLANINKGEVPPEQAWLVDGNIIGRPRATAVSTVEELESLGIVGVYGREHNPNLGLLVGKSEVLET